MEERPVQQEDGGSNPTPSLQKHDWWVRPIAMKDARDLVETYHYSHTSPYPFGVRTHGLWKNDKEEAFGVAWWHVANKPLSVQLCPEDWKKVMNLSRMAIVPEAPKNSASFLLRHSINLLKKEKSWKCLVTFADTWQNHTGAIYKASGWTYLGLTTPKEVWVDSNGSLAARKYGPKFYTKSEMDTLGYKLLGKFPKHKFVLYL